MPLVAPLQAKVVGMLCGERSLYAVAQLIRERAEDEPERLAALGQLSAAAPHVRGHTASGVQGVGCAHIVPARGDYLLPVKDNQPALHDSLARAFSPLAAQRP